MQIEIIDKIDSFIKEETGEIILKIQPKKFVQISNEKSGQIVLNEILNILGFAPIDLLDEVVADDIFIQENI